MMRGGPIVFKTHLLQLREKIVFRYVGFGLSSGSGDKAATVLDGDGVVRVDDAGAKFDRGDVSFASGAQAQDETKAPSAHAGLIGMRHDRGIEERGGFERVFAGEKRADEELAGLGKRSRPLKTCGLDFFEVPPPTAHRCRGAGSPKSARHGANCFSVSASLSASARPMMLTIRADRTGMNGRMSTRALSGRKVMPGGMEVHAAHDWRLEVWRWSRARVHFGEREIEGEARFRALVLVDVILHAERRGIRRWWNRRAGGRDRCGRGTTRTARAPRSPEFVLGDAKGFETGGDRRVRLERLLIEARALAAARQKPWQPIGAKCPASAVCASTQPAQRFQADLENPAVRRPVAAEDQRVRELGVVVGGAALEPLPVRCESWLGQLHKRPVSTSRIWLTTRSPEKRADIRGCEQRKGPRARRGEFADRRQARAEREARRDCDARHSCERPSAAPTAQRARAWLSSEPACSSHCRSMAHEIAEAAGFADRTRTKGTRDKCSPAVRSPAAPPAGLLEQHGRMNARALSSVQ